MIIRQCGRNPSFPEVLTSTWKYGQPIPEWLSDVAAVEFVDGEGNITLKIEETSTGGINIIRSGRDGVLVNLASKQSIVCKSTDWPIFSLTPIQFDLLYKEYKK